MGCGGITFYHPTGGKKLNQNAVGCGGLRWVAVGCALMLGLQSGEGVAYLRSAGCSQSATAADLRGGCSPLEDLSFAVSIAIAYSPMVSHGDAWTAVR